MDKIIECLNQLNELSIAAGKCQKGQVSHKIKRAKERLGDLALEARRDRDSIDLGVWPDSPSGMRYRIFPGGKVEAGFYTGWDESGTYAAEHSFRNQLHSWVAERVLQHFGISDALANLREDATIGELKRQLDSAHAAATLTVERLESKDAACQLRTI